LTKQRSKTKLELSAWTFEANGSFSWWCVKKHINTGVIKIRLKRPFLFKKGLVEPLFFMVVCLSTKMV
jgi:hypothetical protein